MDQQEPFVALYARVYGQPDAAQHLAATGRVTLAGAEHMLATYTPEALRDTYTALYARSLRGLADTLEVQQFTEMVGSLGPLIDDTTAESITADTLPPRLQRPALAALRRRRDTGPGPGR